MAHSFVAAVNVRLLALLVICVPAQGAELRVLSNIGFQAVMEDIGPRFERATGHKLAMTFGTVGAVIKRMQGGETFDVVVVTQSGIDGLVKDGKVAPENASVVAFSRSGVAVRKGAPKPDISSAEALKRSLLSARSITYSDPATGAVSGIHFTKLLDRLGIAKEMTAKTVFHPKPGFAALLVANGQADIVVQPFQELIPVDGIEIVGPLPGDLQQTVVISVGIPAAVRDMEASKALVNFLRTAEATAVIKTKGLDPAGAEVKVLSVLGMRAVMEDLGPKFERATGHKLAITVVTLGVAVKRVQDGETADVVVIPRQGIDGFAKDGRAAAADVTVIARSSIGVAVRKGAPKPDISSPEALKRTLLIAKSITYPNPAHGAASGIHFAKMLDRLGIADEMKSKTVFLPKAGPVGVLVANGEAEIAVHQLQELIPVAGIEIVGPLPGDLQDTLVFAAAIMGGTKDAAASKALVDFLRTPESAKVIKEKGMEPGIR